MPPGTAKSRGCSDRRNGSSTTTHELRDKAVVYINTDGNGRGFLSVGGSHALEQFVNGVARDVEDPETKSQRLEAHAGEGDRAAAPPTRASEARRGPICGSARSGQDPTTRRFSSTPASPSLNLWFRRRRRRTASTTRSTTTTITSRSFSTRTSRTDVRWRRRSAVRDPAGRRGRACRSSSRAWPTRCRRTSASAGAAQDSAGLRRGSGTGRSRKACSRRLRIRVAPWAPSSRRCRRRSISRRSKTRASALTQAAERYQKDARCVAAARRHADAIRHSTRVDAERTQLTDAAGLPRRPWYPPLLYAPGFYTGYAVKTMPGVREAIEQKDFAEAEREIARVAEALDRETELDQTG